MASTRSRSRVTRQQLEQENEELRRLLAQKEAEPSLRPAEEDLKASERRFRSLIENGAEQISILSQDGTLLYENPTTRTILNYAHGSLIGQSVWDIVHPDDLSRLRAEFELLLQNPDAHPRDEFRLRSSDGSWRWVEGVATNLLSEPSIHGIVLNYHDITERKQSEVSFRYLFANNPQPMWVYDLETLAFLEVNEAAIEKYGYSHDEFMQMTIRDIRLPDEWLRLELNLARTRPPQERTGPWKHRTKDGRLIDVEITSHEIEFLGHKARLVLVTDITERKHAEESLRQNEDRYRDLVENSHDLICTHDLDGNLLSVNPYPGEILGYSTEELLQMNLRDVLTPEAQMYLPDYLSNIRQHGVAKGDMHVKTRRGEVRIWEYRNTLRTEGVETPIVRGMARDVTEQRRAEEKFKQSERELAEAQRVAHLGSWTREEPSGAVRWSTETYRIFGVEPGTPVDYQTFIRRVHPEDVASVEESLQRALATGGEFRYEFRIILDTGETKNVVEMGHPIRDASGKVAGFFGIAQDITERKQAEEKLRQSERDLAEAQRVARVGSWRREVPSQIVRWSEEMFEIFGVERGTPVTYETFIRRVHPEDVPRVEQDSERALAEGAEFQHEFRIVLSTGAIRSIREVGHAVKDANGNVTGLFGTAQDITEQSRAEEQLRYQAALLANISDGIIATDASYRITSWNQAAEAMVGWKAEEVLGKDLRIVLPYGEGNQGLRPADMPGDHFRTEYTLARKDGTPIWIETSYITMRDAMGRITARVGVSRDMTDRKRAEERERQQMQRLLALREIDTAITSSLDERFTLNMLLTQVTSTLEVDAAAVLLLNSVMGTLNFAAGHGFRQPPARSEVPLTAYHSGDAARERRVVIEPDLQRSALPFARREMVEQEQFKAYVAAPLIAKGEVKGVLEIFHRSQLAPDAEWLDFLQTLAGQAAIAIDNAQLFEGLQRSNFELAIAYDSTIEGWSRALDLRDKETEGHTQRVTALTIALAKALGFSNEEIVHVRRGALLHDIGKMGVPDAILLKPGPLTDEEWVLMKKHPSFAYELLTPIRYLKSAALDIPYCHHERWDGSGYPKELKGEQIPFSARIFAVIDVWDALTSDRPYRPAWTKEQAVEYIRAQSGTQFDPRVVEAFVEMLREGA